MVLSIGPAGYTLFLSVHFIHKHRQGRDSLGTDLIDDVRQETLRFLQECKSKYGNNLSIVSGFDETVTLPGNVEQITGNATLQPLRSHTTGMQERILGWMQLLGIRAINTFGDKLAPSELWTCGIKRKAQDRSQIDFIGVTPDFSGQGNVFNILDMKSEPPLMIKMDHRPVRAELGWTSAGSTGRVDKPMKGLPKRPLANDKRPRTVLSICSKTKLGPAGLIVF